MRVTVLGFVVAALLASLAGPRASAQDTGRTGQDTGRTGQDIVRPPAQEPPGQIAVTGADANLDPNQPIRAGMTLSVTVSSAAGYEADESGVFQVDSSGSIQMKLIGLVPVRGLTASQASDKIAALLKTVIKDPKAIVTIVSVPKPIIFYGGAVPRPGAMPVNDTTTLGELLTIAGFTENADLSRVRVTHRDEEGKLSTREYNVFRWLRPAPGQPPDESQNPVLTDRDSVFVPMKTLPGTGSVQVEGDVLRPGIVSTRVGVPITLREALSLSGGPMPTADRREVAVRRMGSDQPIVVDYDRVEAGDPTQNIVLQPDDVVYLRKVGIDQFVNLTGAFTKPGKLAYNRPMTLTEAIAEVGGLIANAKVKDGRVFRHVNGVGDPAMTQVIAFNYEDIRANKQRDIRLEPGDTVDVPITEIRPRPDTFQTTTQILSMLVLLNALVNRRGTGY